MKMHCLIIEDEPIARDILEGFCSKLPNLQVVGSCSNAIEGLEMLQSHQVDILFLDINLPMMNGLDMLRTLSHKPQVILTTAYSEFAVEAFELNVVDYLLKPISFERFVKAVNKCVTPSLAQRESENLLTVKSGSKLHRINLSEVIYLEAQGNYTRVVYNQHADNIYVPFSQIEALLDETNFIRVHRSFMVNKQKVTTVESSKILLQNHEVPIGRTYQEAVKRLFGLDKY